MIIDEYKTQIDWLLEGDSAIRYQTLRDLTETDNKEIGRVRDLILKEGWGKQFMDLQDEEGTWSKALYSPKWTSTFYTLLLLKRLGAPCSEQITKACLLLLDNGFYEPDGGINYWKTWKQGECCVTGMLLSILCHFRIDDERIHSMRDYLFTEQMKDGGWNCERYRGAVHSSFHTTISVLEGLREYEKAYHDREAVTIQKKQDQGLELLLQHHLYKSDNTWKTIDSKMIRLSFPSHWHYDILRCLDYCQERAVVTHPAMNDAIDLLKNAQTTEGLWKREIKFPGKIFFEMERVGQVSRWNTLRALRVLRWWEE